MRKKLLLIPFIFVVLICISFLTIRAQNANKGLVVFPSNFDLSYASTPTTGKVTLLNNNDQPVTVHVDLRNFTANGEEGTVILTDTANSFSLASWISVTPSTVTLDAHKSQEFTFTITPPKNAEPGGHFGSIVFATIPNSNIKGTAGASISQEIASLILYRIPGNANENALMESFTTDKSFYETGPITLTARIRNTGSIHIAPIGQVIVKGMLGDKYILQFNPRNILPNAVRKIPVILPQKFLIGQYSATLLLSYGSKNEQLHGYVEFFAFPVRYALLAGIILLGIFLIRKRLLKAFKALITGK